ncbi:hypothetical protein PI124_g19453 [Phytophthora idaei]|nr:hypothetical protein PI124_g19453 [Phytophthora idaei]
MDPSDSDSDSNSGNEEADYAFPPLSTTDSDTGERDVNMDNDVTSDVTADPAANGMNVDVEPPSAATAPNTSAQGTNAAAECCATATDHTESDRAGDRETSGSCPSVSTDSAHTSGVAGCVDIE